MNVLMLDDDVLDLQGMKLLVDWKKHGIENVFCVSDVNSACRLVSKQVIDIALCDIELHDESGLDFVEWLNEQGIKTVVIFITSHARFDYAARALQLHARDYLLKPVSPEIMSDSLKKAIAYRKYLVSNNDNIDPDQKFAEEENEVIAQVKKYVKEHIRDNISRNDIAAEIYLHPDYLSHIFKKTMNITLSEYIFQERIKKAKQLLDEDRLSVTEISMESGFSSISYFGKIFKKYEGCTPKEYRNKCFRRNDKE